MWKPLRRWRALRGVPPFTTSTADGTLVHLTGVISAIGDTIIAPLADAPSVVVWTKLRPASKQGVGLETIRVRPFRVTKGALHVQIDTENIQLLRPIRERGTMQEATVVVGERLTVIGSVLHDGVEPPDEETSFREAQPACKLVGSRGRPVVIIDA
jgi:hypothetical protein